MLDVYGQRALITSSLILGIAEIVIASVCGVIASSFVLPSTFALEAVHL